MAAALRMAVGDEDVRRGGGGVNGSGHWDGGGRRRFSSRAPTGRRFRSGNNG
jgi:hypothetical protein